MTNWRSLFALCWFCLCGQLVVNGQCPFLLQGTPTVVPATVPNMTRYNEALLSLRIQDVFYDLYALMNNSQTCWPADQLGGETSYAGLFLRLAWHASGTFRSTSVSAGGSFGGRQRYQPESAWPDNTNLDKARSLLAPIKTKYGDALSWGDLMIWAGTAAILHGDGPVTQVCAGRLDDADGTNSQVLNSNATCDMPNNCSRPLGSSTVGLIYVDPQGFLGDPNPNVTALQIRRVFARMGMNDSETVALIGGGHAFGKCHGACTLGAGPGPDVQPNNPWPGPCGGLPLNVTTSGIEGAWTTYPFRWDNQFFTQLRDDQYELVQSPTGAHQWRNKQNGLLMLTTDLALVHDDAYKQIVNTFAGDINELNSRFSQTWQKLVTSGGTFATNGFCVDGNTLRPSNVSAPSVSPTDSPTTSPATSTTTSPTTSPTTSTTTTGGSSLSSSRMVGLFVVISFLLGFA